LIVEYVKNIISFPRHMDPWGDADLRFHNHQPDTSLCRETMDTGLMHYVVCLLHPSFRSYHVILLDDRGTLAWTTCPRLLLNSAASGAWTCNH